MGTVKDDEDFWYSSETRSFSFENNEVDQLFGVSKTDTEKLWAGISDASISEEYLKPTPDSQSLKPILSVISDKTLSRILAASKLQISETEVVVQPNITLKKILLGQPYTLEHYKSLANKIALLDAAIASGNGNAILIIILFIVKTLKKSIVQRILSERPDAVNVYINYLSIRLQTNELTDLLTMMGRSTDAAMKNLHIIIKNTKDTERLLQKLRSCYKTQFSTILDCREANFVHCYIKLLEWQIAVRRTEGDDSCELNSSVLESLRYVCKDHWAAGDGTLISPSVLCAQHDILPRQFQKVGLQVRAAAGQWEDVDRLLLTKGWLGSKKLQTCLSIEDIVKTLYKCHAPPEVLEKYLKYVDNIEKRLELAQSFNCYRVAIDTFVLQGDRSALLVYKAKLQPQSEEYFYAESALRLPSVKWKN